MTKAAVVYNFWSGFALEAYEENTVPVNAKFPYITYQLVTDSFGDPVIAAASLWFRSESWKGINDKTEEISGYIGNGGIIFKCDGGRVWIKRGQPFAQNMGDESDSLIKRKYLNIIYEFLTEN